MGMATAVSRKTNVASRRPKPGAWFVPLRGSYLPASPAGWLCYLPFVAYLLFVAYLGHHTTTSLGVALLLIVPNWVAASVVLTWFAARKS